ncbi:MAG TPA: hypothetical protein VK850_11120 [Candidatus Binatia bacterium]|nr:hypothetical protein [Candidatus Binatia bacterium]
MATFSGHKHHPASLWKFPGRLAVLLFFCLSLAKSFAHDPTELTTGVYLRNDCLEVRVTVAAQTVLRLLAADGQSVAALSSSADVDRARSALNACAAGLFRVSAAGKLLTAQETNVTLSVEDHIEMKLVYPRPEPGLLRLDAVHLKKLPADEPYGAVVTAVDMGTKVFLAQKLLKADDPSLELKTPPAPPANSTAPAAKPR